MADDVAHTIPALDAIIAPYVTEVGGLMRALNALQAELGYIDAAATARLAEAFNFTKAEVKGVISFYEDFTTRPRGKHVIRICQAEACQSVGARTLTKHAIEKLGIGLGETTADGRVTLEPVYCLGLCANGPAVMADGKPKARVTVAAFDKLAGVEGEGA